MLSLILLVQAKTMSTRYEDWSPLTFEVNPLWIRAVHPRARFVALLRNPLARAESDYNFAYFVGRAKKLQEQGSRSHMHQNFVAATELFSDCTQHQLPLDCWRHTAVHRNLNCAALRTDHGHNGSAAFVLRGLYSVWLGWFLSVFPPEQLFVRRAEEEKRKRRHFNPRLSSSVLKELFAFAGLSVVGELPKASSESEHLWAPGLDSGRPSSYESSLNRM
eukprot:s5456_g2.t1